MMKAPARLLVLTYHRVLESFELAGPVERLGSAVNGGIKHLPLRYRLA